MEVREAYHLLLVMVVFWFWCLDRIRTPSSTPSVVWLLSSREPGHLSEKGFCRLRAHRLTTVPRSCWSYAEVCAEFSFFQLGCFLHFSPTTPSSLLLVFLLACCVVARFCCRRVFTFFFLLLLLFGFQSRGHNRQTPRPRPRQTAYHATRTQQPRRAPLLPPKKAILGTENCFPFLFYFLRRLSASSFFFGGKRSEAKCGGTVAAIAPGVCFYHLGTQKKGVAGQTQREKAIAAGADTR